MTNEEVKLLREQYPYWYRDPERERYYLTNRVKVMDRVKE